MFGVGDSVSTFKRALQRARIIACAPACDKSCVTACVRHSVRSSLRQIVRYIMHMLHIACVWLSAHRSLCYGARVISACTITR